MCTNHVYFVKIMQGNWPWLKLCKVFNFWFRTALLHQWGEIWCRGVNSTAPSFTLWVQSVAVVWQNTSKSFSAQVTTILVIVFGTIEQCMQYADCTAQCAWCLVWVSIRVRGPLYAQCNRPVMQIV